MKLGLEGVGGVDSDPTEEVRGGGMIERVVEERFDLVELDDPGRLLASLSPASPSLLPPEEDPDAVLDFFLPLSFPSRDFPSDVDVEAEAEGSGGSRGEEGAAIERG